MLTYMRPLIPRQSWIRLYNHNPYRVNCAPIQQILFRVTIVFYDASFRIERFPRRKILRSVLKYNYRTHPMKKL